MANDPTQVATGAGGSTDPTLSSDSITPVSGRLYLAGIAFMRDQFANTVTPPTGWDMVATYTDSNYLTVRVYRALGQNLSSGAQTWTPTGGEHTGFGSALEILEYPTPDTSGTNGSGAVPASNVVTGGNAAALSQTLTYPNAMGAGSGGYVAFANRGGTLGATPRSGWSESMDVAVNGSVGGLETQWRSTTDTAASVTWSVLTVLAGIAVEVVAAGAAASNLPNLQAIGEA